MLDNNDSKLVVSTIITMILGFFIGNMIFAMFALEISSETTEINPLDLPAQRLRIGLLISHLFTFAVPGFCALWWSYKKQWWKMVNPLRFPGHSFFYLVIFGFVSLPLVALSMWINLQIPLPEWAMQSEEQTTALLEKVLTFNSPAELIVALLLVGLAAGVGEELIFRGIVQGRILKNLNHHAAIWIAAAIFSLIHMELAGFIPRMVLGAILGYIFHWSGSLIVPMLLHTIFNGSQVVNAYVTGQFTPDTTEVPLPEWYLILFSMLLTIGIGYRLEQKVKNAKSTA